MLPATLTRRSFLGLLAAVPAAAVAATLPTTPGPCPRMKAALEFECDWFLAGRRGGKTMGLFEAQRRYNAMQADLLELLHRQTFPVIVIR